MKITDRDGQNILVQGEEENAIVMVTEPGFGRYYVGAPIDEMAKLQQVVRMVDGLPALQHCCFAGDLASYCPKKDVGGEDVDCALCSHRVTASDYLLARGNVQECVAAPANILEYIQNALKGRYEFRKIKESNTKWKMDVYSAAGEYVCSNYEVPKALAYKAEDSFVRSSLDLFEKSVLIRDYDKRRRG